METFSLEGSSTTDGSFPGNIPRRSGHQVTLVTERVVDNKLQSLLDKGRELEESCLQSSRRSLGLLQESENVGVSAAAELSHQCSKLRWAERQLNCADTSLQSTAKDIRGMRGWWFRFKGVVAGKKPVHVATPAVDRNTSRNISGAIPSPHPTICRTDGPLTPLSIERTKAILDHNLNEMISSIAFLRTLAEDFERELDTQNEMLGWISTKVEGTDAILKQQTRELKELL